MHLILLLVAATAVAAIAYQLGTSRKQRPEPLRSVDAPRRRADHSVAFISRGKLFCCTPGQAPREIQSPYIQGVLDRTERSRQLHGWKEGTALNWSIGGRQRGADGDVRIQATSALFAGDDRMLYFLRDDSFGGLFEQDLTQGTEKRVLHKQNLALDDLRLSPDGGRLLCAKQAPTGISNIAVMNVDGSDFVELTGGDTADTAPCWVAEDPNLVVFQSAGLARDPAGHAIALGPASIQMIDVRKGSLSTVLEDPAADFLQPRVGTDGCLYFIRRPYDAGHYNTRTALSDALLFPFRLLRALFHYLNFFSMMYSRKPLTTASGPRMEADLKEILVKGKRFDAETALRRGALVNGVPSLVPASWELVRRSQRGEESILASHVAAFDLAANGDVLFSNGYGVFVLDGANPPHVLLRDKLVGEVVAGSPSIRLAAAAQPATPEAEPAARWQA